MGTGQLSLRYQNSNQVKDWQVYLRSTSQSFFTKAGHNIRPIDY